MWEQLFDAVLDALLDSVKIIPIMFLVYVLIEVIENKSALSIKKQNYLNNKYSPIVASSLGIIPQCGFSVIATDLYAKKRITVGTLLAVYIATSDEAIPIILSTPSAIGYLLPLIITKFLFAILVGYGAMLFIKIIEKNKCKLATINKEESLSTHTENDDNHTNEEQCDCDHHTSHKNSTLKTTEDLKIADVGCCGHNIEDDPSSFKKFIIHPLKHVLKIFIFILIVNLIFSITLTFINFEQICTYLLTGSVFQPFIVGLIGLIPNCASSVVITQLFIMGGISFGSCITGLCINAGIAIAVLFKENKNKAHNFYIVGSLYLLSSLLGFAIMLLF